MFTNYKSLRRFPKNDVDIFAEVYSIASLVWKDERANPKKKLLYRCHSVCRALAEILPTLTVIDGHYLGCIQTTKRGLVNKLQYVYYPHTWLLAPNGSIIDPYPVACVTTPILVVTKGKLGLFGSGLYVPNPRLTRRFSTPKIIAEAKRLAIRINKLQQKNKLPVAKK